MEQSIQEMEARDALRLSWMRWPVTKTEAARSIVPLAAMYTPLAPIDITAQVEYEPVRCSGKGCASILNPYCEIDFMNRIWICPFCLTRNHLPSCYSNITVDNLPPELISQYSTIEYCVPSNLPIASPYILFVLDTCIIDLELRQACTSIIEGLSLLPPDAMVGLITFGKHVSVHELGFAECSKSYVFRGNPKTDNVDATFVADMLGLKSPSTQGAGSVNQRPNQSFFLPVQACSDSLTAILTDIVPDPWPVRGDERPSRATGVASSVAIGLLESVASGANGRIMLFTGGAASAGPGKIVSVQLSETIRSHHDLFKGNSQWHDKACKFYSGLADRVMASGYAFDIFACSLDQVGVAEMKVLVEKSGGFLVLVDMFDKDVFRESFRKCFSVGADGFLQMGFNGEISCITSKEIRVSGAIGLMTSLQQKGISVSDKETGIGNTNAWRLCAVTPSSSYAFYFEVVNTTVPANIYNSFGYLQWITSYRDCAGYSRIRVTTIAIPFADTSTDAGLSQVRNEFDSEAAAVLVARLAIFKAETEFTTDILRWLDAMLIRLMARFASFTKDQPDTFRISQSMSFFPQFVFHLRRSQFLHVVNASPDETAFFRLVFLRENVINSSIMIQPMLRAHQLDTAEPFPVLLDASSVNAERVLVLDTFFNVVLWYGETIAQWRDDGLADDPNYDYFKQLLVASHADAMNLVNTRFPVPIFVECDQGGSQSRFLVAKLNPSVTHNTGVPGYGPTGGAPPVFTDDVSLLVFMDHLRKLAVQN